MSDEYRQDRASTTKYIERKKQKPLTFKILDALLSLFGFIILTWIISIVVEWIGMAFIWPEEGSQHSERMLEKELKLLNKDYLVSILGTPPAVLAYSTALTVKFYLFEWTHLIDFYEWLKIVDEDSHSIRQSIAKTAILVNEYFIAFINATLIFSIRMTVATLTMPLFIFIGLAAVIDGLVQRELRIYGGGIERSSVYHHAKPWIKPSILTPWFFYLSIPFSIHPNWIFIPAMLTFGLSVFLTFALFKKHL